ncbi:MAG: hypothetical protein MJH10_19510 [Epibacterium sp.]|nr:hypothetical protein [Epibacterium sp.]NQX75671.1 hypothetical protein [Epibacterium sp.]
MAKTLTCTLALALTITLTSAPAAMADDVPFVQKLLEAAERGKVKVRRGVSSPATSNAPRVQEAVGTGIRG